MAILTYEEAAAKSARVASGHAYDEHIIGKKNGYNEFAAYGVNDRVNFARHITETVCDESTLAIAIKERDTYLYCNPQTKTFVSFDQSKDGGTAFILGSKSQVPSDCIVYMKAQHSNLAKRFMQNPIIIYPEHEIQQASCEDEKERQTQTVAVAQTATTSENNKNSSMLASIAFGADAGLGGVPVAIEKYLGTGFAYVGEKALMGKDADSISEIYRQIDAGFDADINAAKSAHPNLYNASAVATTTATVLIPASKAPKIIEAGEGLLGAVKAMKLPRFKTSEVENPHEVKTALAYNNNAKNQGTEKSFA